MRGIAGVFERSWSGEPGSLAWTKALLPASAAYALASRAARGSAAARRRKLPGTYVIAVGNLTVGGAGKTSVARWLALTSVSAGAHAAVLLRGHGASVPGPERGVVPDFAGYPLAERVARYGDEAIALRTALPRGVSVAVDPDRWRAARAVRSGYGARVLVLDDGWEQPGLRWDELWVALDPLRPLGNGSLLPAGPLRRPAASIREADRIVFLLETPEENVPEATLAWLGRTAPGVPRLRLLRTLRDLTPVGAPGGSEPQRAEPPVRGAKVALVSGVGAPSRLERFLRGAGADVCFHGAFPDHARWRAPALLAALHRASDAGAERLLITEKDEPRWPRDLRAPMPVRVIRTGISALDPTDEALRPLRSAAAAAAEGSAAVAEGSRIV